MRTENFKLLKLIEFDQAYITFYASKLYTVVTF
jgi:hypothetical protein